MSVTFRIKASEACGRRLDPHFHTPAFRMNRSRIESHRHLAMKGLGELSDETWDKAQDFQDRFPYVDEERPLILDINPNMAQERWIWMTFDSLRVMRGIVRS